jgi:hypothetical protein
MDENNKTIKIALGGSDCDSNATIQQEISECTGVGDDYSYDNHGCQRQQGGQAEEGKNEVVEKGVRESSTSEVHGTTVDDDEAKTDVEVEVDAEVVGRCIECQCPFDAFSGTIVCTVCRQPLLVCPGCVRSACLPGEYHCYRHR